MDFFGVFDPFEFHIFLEYQYSLFIWTHSGYRPFVNFVSTKKPGVLMVMPPIRLNGGGSPLNTKHKCYVISDYI